MSQTGPIGAGGPALRFHELLQRWGPAYLERFGAAVPRRQREALGNLLACRTPALRYLIRCVFKTATGDRDIPLLPHGRVRWRCRQSDTGRPQHIDLEPFELIRCFLQHVLPAGFHRVRRFGWLHPAGRVKLNRVRALLAQAPVLSDAERAAWQPPEEELEPSEPLPAPGKAPACPRCQRPMIGVGSLRPAEAQLDPPERAPP
jgi:hypothetical protein